MKSYLRSYIFLIAVSTLLAGCSAHCNCPECPGRTTVVNPQPGTTVVTPDNR